MSQPPQAQSASQLQVPNQPQAQIPVQDTAQILAYASLQAATSAQPPFPGPSALPTADEIADSPWKYAGYRQFTRWVASDQAWLITRRFGTVNARIILFLQDNIVSLEEQLNKLDHAYSQSSAVMGDDDQSHNGSFRLESYPDRQEIMHKLIDAVKQYNSFINDYSQLASRPAVRKGDVNAVRAWLGNNQYAIHDPEAAYINSKYEDDLIPVHSNPRSWGLSRVLEKSRLLRHGPLRGYLSRNPCDLSIRNDEGMDTAWHNERHIEIFSTTVISIIGLGMIIGPLWVLDQVGTSQAKLGIISGFLVLFYLLVGLGTTASLFESLAAVAAYSAVLMVFMQIKKSDN